jgi:hypothetical protein
MKKVFLFTMSAIMLTFIFESCKKKDTATTIQKIQAKWSIESVIDHEHDPSSLPIDTTVTTLGVATDYIDFRSDGKVYSFFDGSADTSAYALSGDTSIIISTSGNLKIQSLTDHVLKLYEKEDDPSTSSYFEETINLKK